MHPKYKIIFGGIKLPIFQYCDSNIKLGSITFCKLISFNLLCFIISIGFCFLWRILLCISILLLWAISFVFSDFFAIAFKSKKSRQKHKKWSKVIVNDNIQSCNRDTSNIAITISKILLCTVVFPAFWVHRYYFANFIGDTLIVFNLTVGEVENCDII